AWSQNLTAEKAAAQGVERVEKDELFRRSDILSVHLVLSDRSRGLVGAREIGLMKPTAILVNTSRGPICDTAAVIEALKHGRLALSRRRARRTGDRLLLCRPIPHPLRLSVYGGRLGVHRCRRGWPRHRSGVGQAGDRALYRTRLSANGGGDRWPRNDRLDPPARGAGFHPSRRVAGGRFQIRTLDRQRADAARARSGK